MVTQNYTISTVKTATPPKVKMSQYDYGMRTITFAVVDGSGAAVDLTGKTVTVEGTRIDGHTFATTCTVADNEATFVDTVDMTNAAGDHPAELVVRQNDERLGTMNFIISVEPAAMDEGADVSPEDKNLFEQLYAKVVSGSPVAVDTVAEMTNTDGVYLYTGNESGYTKGYWYYYDGSAWVAGGAYGSGATDKTLTLSDVAADAKVVGDYLDEISEGILESYVTEGSYTSAGVTTERISDTELKVYGTCTANRRFNVYNGFQTIRTTSSPFQEMLPAGTYRISLTANKTVGNPRVTFTYTTYADALWTVLNGQTVVYEFTQPFMFGFYANTNINYGTEDDPTIVTLRIESLTAKDEVARETKADKDGTYPDLTAGQLYTENGVENVEPYFFRAVPVAAREARMKKLVGGTVAWNQLVQNGDFATNANWVVGGSSNKPTLSIANNEGTITLQGASWNNDIRQNIVIPKGHVNFISVTYKMSSGLSSCHLVCRQGSAQLSPNFGYSSTFKTENFFGKYDSDQSIPLRFLLVENGSSYSGESITFKNIYVIDLTLALGSTIADYIYSLETATAGAGVAFFRKYFPEDYYAYNAGELKSVEGVSEKVTYDANENVLGTYPLDSDLTLRGIPKLADGKMYFDGDEYASDGTVTRKYGVVTLNGSESWTFVETYVSNVSRAYISIADIDTSTADNLVANVVSNRFQTAPYSSQSIVPRVTSRSGIAQINIFVPTMTRDAFLADLAAHPVTVVYELATPTTETADPFTESEIIDPYGTEEFVSTGIVPVGHDTLYVDDLKQRLEDIAPPTTDGTYTLQVTVSGGRPTFAWVAANRSLSMGNPFASAAEDETTDETDDTEETAEETEEPVEEGDMR